MTDLECSRRRCSNPVTERGYCSYRCKQAASQAADEHRHRIVSNTIGRY